MGFYEAAEKVLKKTRRPMSVKAITKRALKNKLLKTNSIHPSATMGARLYMDIIRNGAASRFVKVDKGIFGLKKLKHLYKWKNKLGKPERIVKGIVKAYSDPLGATLLDKYANFFEGKSGIYALFDANQKLWYVGQTINLGSRIDTHQRDKHRGKWETFQIFEVQKSKLDSVESILIQVAKPRGNGTKGNLKGARNITFDIRSKIKAEIKTLKNLMIDT